MAKNFFELSETYLSRDGNGDRFRILEARKIIVDFLSRDYLLNKDDIPLIQAHLNRSGLSNSEGMIRNIARMYRLVYLALNGDEKTVEYLSTIKKGLRWMRLPLDDLRKDGFVNWQSVEVYWQEREKERFCRVCKAKQSLAQALDDYAICQAQLLRLREQVEESFRERAKFSIERAAAFKVLEENVHLKKRLAELLCRETGRSCAPEG